VTKSKRRRRRRSGRPRIRCSRGRSEGAESIFSIELLLIFLKGNAAQKIAVDALNQYPKWIQQIHEWQQPILSDATLPHLYKMALFNELYFLTEGGTIWTDGSPTQTGKQLSPHFLFTYSSFSSQFSLSCLPFLDAEDAKISSPDYIGKFFYLEGNFSPKKNDLRFVTNFRFDDRFFLDFLFRILNRKNRLKSPKNIYLF
jgi:hypothetical protein